MIQSGPMFVLSVTLATIYSTTLVKIVSATAQFALMVLHAKHVMMGTSLNCKTTLANLVLPIVSYARPIIVVLNAIQDFMLKLVSVILVLQNA